MFSVTKLGLSISELYRITWAEFELRSFGFWRDYKEKKITEAKLNWRIYCQWNKKPKSFSEFLRLEYGIKIPKGKMNEVKREAMLEAWAQYEKELKENG